jgi:hypothetical protein
MKIEVDSQEIEEMKTLLGIVDNYATKLFLESSSQGPSHHLARIMQYLGEAQMKLDNWVEIAK